MCFARTVHKTRSHSYVLTYFYTRSIATYKIEELLKELKKEYTVIIVIHSMQLAARISDYIGLFLNGELIEFSNTKDIFTNTMDKKLKTT